MAQAYCPGYLFASLLLLAVACGFLLALPSLRRLMLVSGLLSAPFALVSHFFVPAYWQPQRLAVLVTGLEDIIFSFANGVIVFGLAAWALPPVFRGFTRPSLGRYLLLALAPTPVILTLLKLGLGVMSAVLLAGIAVWALCLWSCRGRTGLLSLAGGAGFAVFYCLVLKLSLHLFPEMGSWWTGRGLAGFWVGGIPLGELLWAIFYGSTWPLVVGWTLGWRGAGPVPGGGVDGVRPHLSRNSAGGNM